MSMIVQVIWEGSGKPCQGTRVQCWINGQGNAWEYTNERGEAFFPYGPGIGTVYCDGREVIGECSLGSRVIIRCHSVGLFSWGYS
jgi:hypothetical protein